MKAAQPSPQSSATAVAHPNIALIKYWGKRPGANNLPAVGSLSVTLDTWRTRPSVTLDGSLDADTLAYGDEPAGSKELGRTGNFLRAIRNLHSAGDLPFCRVVTHNNFLTGAGLASSASGFAALTLAACAAYGVTLTPEALSAQARAGSGSAARSIFGGIVAMDRGERPDGSDAVARPLAAPEDWPLQVVVAITHTEAKAIGSTEGMNRTKETSPYWDAWVGGQARDLQEAADAVRARDFVALAEVSEHSCFKMHALALSARPKILYWRPSTVGAMQAIARMRDGGVPVFCTMDAGPQVKAICLPEASAQVARVLAAVPGVQQVVILGLGQGARLTEAAPS